MIVISSSVVLSQTEAVDALNPRIGWRNIVTTANVTADEEADDEPVSNLGNPATYLAWRGTSIAQQSVMVALPVAQEVNYFAIAGHNLGSTGASVVFQSSTNGTDWESHAPEEVPANDHCIIHEFDPVFAQYFRLLITPGSEPPSIAVWYVGKTLVLQRRIYVGHTPLPYGRKSTISTGRSENGQFLGRVLRRETYETSVNMQNITPSWFRQNMEPFIRCARTKPFFFAWRPSQYPQEVGYAWLTDDVRMSNQRANGMVQMSFTMQAVR